MTVLNSKAATAKEHKQNTKQKKEKKKTKKQIRTKRSTYQRNTSCRRTR
jgi:hypothetical protein